jgi:D-alanyl-lipoteichoic acid acyltransferase DltB (MBOAT superfamily)
MYASFMSPGFKRIAEAAVWFVLGFLTHMLLLHYHNHPFR